MGIFEHEYISRFVRWIVFHHFMVLFCFFYFQFFSMLCVSEWVCASSFWPISHSSFDSFLFDSSWPMWRKVLSVCYSTKYCRYSTRQAKLVLCERVKFIYGPCGYSIQVLPKHSSRSLSQFDSFLFSTSSRKTLFNLVAATADIFSSHGST